MSAIICLIGKELDCEAIAKIFPGALVSAKQQPNRSRKAHHDNTSSVNIQISRKGLTNVKGQIQDAVVFLQSNKRALQKALKAKGVEDAFISFACAQENNMANFYYFPQDLALLAGELKLGLRLCLFRCSS
jgi:hypothetical protein